jgi:protein TonB
MSTQQGNWKHFDIEEADPEESRLRRLLPYAGAGLMVLVLGGAGVLAVSKMGGTSAPQPPPVQQISLVVPPPPPPPPPRLEEPEPQLEELELDTPEPDLNPMADDSAGEPGGDELGLDADGVAGSDAFGLAARRGGRSLLGGGGDRHAWYAGVVQRDLQTALANNAEVRRLGDYAVTVSIWLGEDGTVRRTELVNGTSDPRIDATLSGALAAGMRLSREPPDDLPQPIRLRITSRS